MLSELRSDLEAIYSNVNDSELVKRILTSLSEINVTDMTKDRALIADLFYETMVSLQGIEAEEIKGKVFDAFINISQIAKAGEENASLILLNFLNELYQHRQGQFTKIDVTDEEAIILLKDLEPIKFIFLLSDEKEERYFPINRLLSNIVFDQQFICSKIEPYHINLLQLAVEMFKMTGEEDPQEQVEKLITDCHLQFINYLDGTAVRVDTVDMANYRHNGVMVFYNEQDKKVLVRHENENYFNTIQGVPINHETNSQGVVIGHSVELTVEGEAIDYSDAIKESPVELLKLIYARECKNVLIEKMILKTAEGKFVPLNPFCLNDNWIVKGRINKRDGKSVHKEHILECLDECRLHLFSTDKQYSGINKLSYGLCVYLLEKEKVDIDQLFSNVDTLGCQQNTIIRNWVNLSSNKKESLEFILRKWAEDLDFCDREETIGSVTFEKGRIRDTLPFALKLEWVYQLLEMADTPSVFVGTISYEDEEGKYYIDFTPKVNKSLAREEHSEIDGVYFSDVILSEETEKENIYQEQMRGYFVLKDDKWYFDSSLQGVLKILVNIELRNARLINEQIISYFDENKCRTIFDCMKLHRDELLDVEIKKVDDKSMFTYRLVHNILLNNINESNKKEYVDIFIKHQKITFNEIYKDKLFSEDAEGTIIVPKDKLESDAVLRSVYDKYIRRHAVRDDLWWYSSKGLSCLNGEYYKNGQKINTMRFLFDNTELGTATIRTLAANIGKESEWVEFVKKRNRKSDEKLKRQLEKQIGSSPLYALGDTVIKPREIYAANNPRIVVHSYYGTKEGDQLIKDFLDSCGLQKKDYDVSHEYNILYKASMIKQECSKLGLDFEHNSDIYIVIREFNMTKKTLMPKGAVGEANRIGVLFVMKNELA